MCWCCEGGEARPLVAGKHIAASWRPQQIHLIARGNVIVAADRVSLLQLSPMIEQFAAEQASGATTAASLSAAAFDEPVGGLCVWDVDW